jgi:hypothetical protein
MVDSGASKHTTSYKDSFYNLTHNDSSHKVKLGDEYQYPIKGVGESSYKLDSGKPMKMKEVLYCNIPNLRLLGYATQELLWNLPNCNIPRPTQDWPCYSIKKIISSVYI